MNISNLSNQELAAEVQHWANKADNNTSGEWTVSADDLRIIAERLLLPTDDDVENAVDEAVSAVMGRVKKRVERRATQLKAIISDLKRLERELENDGDSRHYESDVEDDDE